MVFCCDCKEEISFCRTIDSIDYCLKCAVKYEKVVEEEDEDDGKTKRFWAEVHRRMDCGNTCEFGSGPIGARCDKCKEAEEAEEDDDVTHICGETGGHRDGGCGKRFNYEDGIMIDNTSYCISCGEIELELEVTDDEDEQCVGLYDGKCCGKKNYKTEELDLGMCKVCYDKMKEEANVEQCNDCKIEAKKHCDVCGGYGGGSEDEE